jgi:hypothetical protein
VSSGAFDNSSGEDSCSVYLAKLESGPDRLKARYPTEGLAAITAGTGREAQQIIYMDPLEGEHLSHAALHGQKGKGARRILKAAAQAGLLWPPVDATAAGAPVPPT